MRFIRVGRANERRLRLIFNFFPGPETALLRQCQLEQKSQLRSFSISITRGIREIFEIFEKEMTTKGTIVVRVKNWKERTGESLVKILIVDAKYDESIIHYTSDNRGSGENQTWQSL